MCTAAHGIHIIGRSAWDEGSNVSSSGWFLQPPFSIYRRVSLVEAARFSPHITAYFRYERWHCTVADFTSEERDGYDLKNVEKYVNHNKVL